MSRSTHRIACGITAASRLSAALGMQCDGDINNDGAIDGADRSTARCMGTVHGTCGGDLDRDGSVGGSDLTRCLRAGVRARVEVPMEKVSQLR